jgi:hypothetical protein
MLAAPPLERLAGGFQRDGVGGLQRALGSVGSNPLAKIQEENARTIDLALGEPWSFRARRTSSHRTTLSAGSGAGALSTARVKGRCRDLYWLASQHAPQAAII